MWRWIILLAAVASVFGNFYHLRSYAPFHKRSSQKYCGPEIHEALRVICNGYYNHMFKKSYNFEDDRMNVFLEGEETDDLIPINSKENALSMFSKNYFRNKKGVYDECCRKSCSISELTSYCADGQG
ncbi:LIRP-like [Cimex lectularius]|uniref:Insulin-like domain-containing protein n=1 Tax=Cimex lectularius TaxID=79782 RepID=A0A8I6SKQ1_CIMLE|nr:LIRP-like [Cimex lectularius]